MFSKIDVNGRRADPLWQWLRQSRPGRFGHRITWNFAKFLIARDGTVLSRYAPYVPPAAHEDDIVAALECRR